MSTHPSDFTRGPLVFCPLGFVIAILAHFLLLGVSIMLAVAGHNFYWGSALGYGLLLAVLIWKLVKQQRRSRSPRNSKMRH